jgi:hypothetical protein
MIRSFKTTNFNKVFAGRQPCQIVTFLRRFNDHLRPRHQDYSTVLKAREDFINVSNLLLSLLSDTTLSANTTSRNKYRDCFVNFNLVIPTGTLTYIVQS